MIVEEIQDDTRDGARRIILCKIPKPDKTKAGQRPLAAYRATVTLIVAFRFAPVAPVVWAVLWRLREIVTAKVHRMCRVLGPARGTKGSRDSPGSHFIGPAGLQVIDFLGRDH